MAAAGQLVEIFRSLQGEGAWIGAPQVFLRLAGCTLGCPWCDTRHSWRPGPSWRGLDGRDYANPETAESLTGRLAAWGVGAGTTLSITGGEPLEQAPFLADLLPRLRERKVRLHLETAAADPAALVGLLPWLEHLSMDWKLPATLGGRDLTGAYRACLERLRDGGATVAVKIPVDGATPEAEVVAALEAVHERLPRATCILQPLSREGEIDRQALDRGLALLWGLVGRFPGLRLLPQIHPLLGLE